ncbi:substrate-binding domain-containing protein [Streptomyces sp. NPDC005970]|uniref:substrate-binding domain-containing protein n=1 Tax=Streptomyces sp. NPDC005970 TaxID=3156723 RepID=UPI003405EB37
MTRNAQPGQLIGGRYRLVSDLGSGGFGRVWKAHDETLRIDVAVKELWLLQAVPEAEQAERLARAEREARNAARLRDHPNIVAVHDVVIEDDRPWIVMQLVDGSSLEKRLAEHGPLSAEEATEVAARLLHALGAAHDAGIVHRDVKPANVMMAEDGKVLLADFGIAVHHSDTALTATGAVIGSVEYMAPERVRGTDGLAASDLFSLGVTLYQAVEGVSPFRRDTPTGSLTAVLFDQAPPPRRAGALAPLITGLLEKDPDRRPTVPAALTSLRSPTAAMTTQTAHHLPETVTVTSPSSTATSRPRRRAGALVAAGALVLALAATGLVLKWPFGGSDDKAAGKKVGGGTRAGTIGLALPTEDSERWTTDGNAMKKQFEAKGYQVDLQYGDGDANQQAAQIDNMIATGHKLLVVAPVDGAALADVLKRAKDAGIKVIAYDVPLLNTDAVDYYVSFDSRKAGRLQGDYIVHKLGLDRGEKGPFNIELFAGAATDPNTRYFFDGAMDTLKPYIDKHRIVVRSGETNLYQLTTDRWDGAAAQKRMSDLLSESYTKARLDAVLSPYDGMSLGIVSAFKSAGYGIKNRPYPIVTGQDAELASVKSINEGEQTQTVFKDSRKLAKAAVRIGDAMLSGGKPEADTTTTYDNNEKEVPSSLLPPVSIDKSNTRILVAEGYYTAAELGQ